VKLFLLLFQCETLDLPATATNLTGDKFLLASAAACPSRQANSSTEATMTFFIFNARLHKRFVASGSPNPASSDPLFIGSISKKRRNRPRKKSARSVKTLLRARGSRTRSPRTGPIKKHAKGRRDSPQPKEALALLKRRPRLRLRFPRWSTPTLVCKYVICKNNYHFSVTTSSFFRGVPRCGVIRAS